ncbi:MAG: TlpA family protein disulfide reductase [Chloroflexi bacterium]|nr:MAG: TlpA family protein disulfide reductase [Chloroflexota bacterium]
MTETIQTTTSEKKQTIRWSTLLIWAIVLGLIATLGWALLNTNAPRPEAGKPAPDFSMQFFDEYRWQEKPVANLSDMRGNIIVMNFWASWCVECRLEAELLENTWRKYQDQGVIFLGIDYVDAEPNALAYLKEYDVTYPNAPDLGTDIARQYHITGVPETFIIDRDGTIAHVQIGPINAATLEGVLGKLLAQNN